MTAIHSFSATQQAAIEALRATMSTRINADVVTDYGMTDEGQAWAALGVDSLPLGSFGKPGTLVSVLVGHGVPGVAVIMGADGSTLVEVKTHGAALMALKVALAAGVQEYMALTEGAMQVH